MQGKEEMEKSTTQSADRGELRKSSRKEIPQPIFHTVAEVAKICEVSRNTVDAWVRQGKLGAYQTPGRTNLIQPSDLVTFMHQNGMFVPSSLMEIARIDKKKSSLDMKGHEAEIRHEHTVLVADNDPITRSLAVRLIPGSCQVCQRVIKTVEELFAVPILQEAISEAGQRLLSRKHVA